ncbi:phage portal protein [Salibacterium lacus]|uniref:Phage portal protein n=1 Tax=Salibacterium lacus TaxID=1898109 RepID=A0ABW5SZA9_9BACI
MYPHTPTETERHIAEMEAQGWSQAAIIQELIDDHNTEHMEEGVRYYFLQNDILKREMYKYDDNGNPSVDKEATNNTLPSGWHKLLVDQKTAYLVGDEITIGGDDETAIEVTQEMLGDEFHDIMPELSKNASNKGREWLHVYVDEDGALDYMRVPAQEGIPIYDNNKRQNLEAFIRYYKVDEDTMKIKFYDRDQCTHYENVNGQVVLDATEPVNPEPHFQYVSQNESTGLGWGEVPFIEFANNEERFSDLILYKKYIDAYDWVMSDTTNSLQDVQDVFYLIRGYESTNLDSFVDNIRRYKAAKVGDEGGIEPIQAEVPITSIDSQLDRFIRNIYHYGMGVDTDVDKFGNAPSGVSLKNLYQYLDMKADIMERKFTKSLRRLVWFIAEYQTVTPEGRPFDYKKVTFTFNKSMLTNEAENVTMAKDSQGMISQETIMENHPWVTDVQREKERLQNEQDEYARNMPPVEGEGNEPGRD